MTKLKQWVAKNYPDANRRKFADAKKKGLLFSGVFYDYFEVDRFGIVWGHVCPDCQSNRGSQKAQGDQLSEAGELNGDQSLDRPCLCE